MICGLLIYDTIIGAKEREKREQRHTNRLKEALIAKVLLNDFLFAFDDGKTFIRMRESFYESYEDRNACDKQRKYTK